MLTADGVTRVVVVEPDPAVAALIVAGLRDGMCDVVHRRELAEVWDAQPPEVREGVPTAGVVVVLGPSLVGAEAATAIPELLARGWRVLVTSDQTLDVQSAALLLAGASGFVVLGANHSQELRESVRSVAAGTSALHPLVVDEVLRQWRAASDADRAPALKDAPQLSPRERDVLLGLKDGLTSRMLATKLGVAEKTVEAHKSRLYAKIGARNQAHAVRIAIDQGLV